MTAPLPPPLPPLPPEDGVPGPLPRVPPHREDVIYRRLAEAAGLHFIDLREQYISAGTLRRVPLDVARQRRWVPLIFNERRVVLAIDDPAGAFLTAPEEVATALGLSPALELGYVLASPSAIDAALDRRSTLADVR